AAVGPVIQDAAAVALGEAARDDERPAGALLLQLRELQDRLDRLLARAVDEGAGVDDEALRVLGPLGEREPGLGQHAEHQLGVDLVLRTAERRQMDLHFREPVYRGAYRTADSRGGPVEPRRLRAGF